MKHRIPANLRQRVIAFPRRTPQQNPERTPEAPLPDIRVTGSGFARFMDKLADRWCYFTHPDPLWPMNGVYRCPQCLRTRPVAWGESGVVRTVKTAQEIRLPQPAPAEPAEPALEPQLLRTAKN